MDIVAYALTLITLAGLSYSLLALWCLARFPTGRPVEPESLPALTLFKPLCGSEPELYDNLRSFCEQDYPADLQIIFGLRSASDPAYPIAQQLRAAYPDRDIAIVVDATVHGPNLKASNLVNMARAARHDVFVVSDSDVHVAPDCLRFVAAGLADPETGAVTCLFRGRPRRDGNWVSQAGSLFMDGWFLPAAVVDAHLSGVTVCYGAVTAIRREVIEAEGGFAQLNHILADDTELGHITTRQGRRVALAPIAVDTLVPETKLASLFGHELRWARTTRALRPGAYIASFLTHPLPVPVLAFALHPSLITGSLMGASAAIRQLMLALVDTRLGRAETARTPTPWFLIMRELLYCAVWAAAFLDRRITWRGRKLRILPGARLAVHDAAALVAFAEAETAGANEPVTP